MKQSQQVLEWQEEARQEGFLQGLREARQEGYAQGWREGLLNFLAYRFQAPVPAELVMVIAASFDLEELKRWVKAAARADSLDAFRAAFWKEATRPGAPARLKA